MLHFGMGKNNEGNISGDSETLLTKREAAWRADRSIRQIEKWISQGRLPVAHHDGVRTWFRASDIDLALASLAMPTPVRPEISEYLTGEKRKRLAAEARRIYETGISARQVAVRLGLTEGVTRNILEEAGTKIRQQSGIDHPVFIYALLDQEERYRYVGQTKRDPERRSWAHWEEARRKSSMNDHLRSWLLTLERRPDVRVLDKVPNSHRYKAEERWTLRLLAEGAELLNYCAGNSPKLTELGREMLAKRSREPRPERKFSADARTEMSKRGTTAWAALSSGEREHRSQKIKESLAVPEVREKIAESSRMRWADPVKRAELQAAMRNVKRSPRARENLSEAQRKKWENPEYREQMIKSLKRRICECGLETVTPAMARHLKATKHSLVDGGPEIGKSRTSKWRSSGSTT